MGRAKKQANELPHFTPEEIQRVRDEYLAIQLTPEQRAALRADTEKAAQTAAAEGVYERFAALRGTVTWSIPLEELRGEDDDD